MDTVEPVDGGGVDVGVTIERRIGFLSCFERIEIGTEEVKELFECGVYVGEFVSGFLGFGVGECEEKAGC